MVIKMKDLIKVQNDMLREKFVHNRLDEQPPQPSQDKEDKPPEPQKLKIDIPDSPFEPDVSQIKERRALGELDHPDSSVVNLNNASHNNLEMHWKGKDLVGTVEVLGTPAGNILKELFKSGIKLGISSRGLGSVEEIHEGDGYNVKDDGGDPTVAVQPDFELIAFDFVSNPSTQGAFMAPGSVNESVNDGVGTRKGRCTHDCKIEGIINDIFRGE